MPHPRFMDMLLGTRRGKRKSRLLCLKPRSWARCAFTSALFREELSLLGVAPGEDRLLETLPYRWQKPKLHFSSWAAVLSPRVVRADLACNVTAMWVLPCKMGASVVVAEGGGPFGGDPRSTL